MRKILPLACGAAAALLAGCADYGGGRFDVAAGYDGYYDDFYGPFNDGYWGRGGDFYYMDQGGHRHRDVAHHFRHDAAPGFHDVHGHAPGGGRGERR